MVPRLALAHEGEDAVVGAGVVKEGPITVAGGALEDDIPGCLEPDDVAELAEEGAILRADDDAAAGGDDMAGIGLFGDFKKLEGFKIAECGLAFLFEDFGDFFPHGFLDELVHIGEGVVKTGAELAPDS